MAKRSAAAVAGSASAGWHQSWLPLIVVYQGMMPSPSGSSMTAASWSPMPLANASIHASYSATEVAPPGGVLRAVAERDVVGDEDRHGLLAGGPPHLGLDRMGERVPGAAGHPDRLRAYGSSSGAWRPAGVPGGGQLGDLRDGPVVGPGGVEGDAVGDGAGRCAGEKGTAAARVAATAARPVRARRRKGVRATSLLRSGQGNGLMGAFPQLVRACPAQPRLSMLPAVRRGGRRGKERRMPVPSSQLG